MTVRLQPSRAERASASLAGASAEAGSRTLRWAKAARLRGFAATARHRAVARTVSGARRRMACLAEARRERRLERETGIEPATSSLGSSRSTAELLPLFRAFIVA